MIRSDAIKNTTHRANFQKTGRVLRNFAKHLSEHAQVRYLNREPFALFVLAAFDLDQKTDDLAPNDDLQWRKVRWLISSQFKGLDFYPTTTEHSLAVRLKPRCGK